MEKWEDVKNSNFSIFIFWVGSGKVERWKK